MAFLRDRSSNIFGSTPGMKSLCPTSFPRAPSCADCGTGARSRHSWPLQPRLWLWLFRNLRVVRAIAFSSLLNSRELKFSVFEWCCLMFAAEADELLAPDVAQTR